MQPHLIIPIRTCTPLLHIHLNNSNHHLSNWWLQTRRRLSRSLRLPLPGFLLLLLRLLNVKSWKTNLHWRPKRNENSRRNQERLGVPQVLFPLSLSGFNDTCQLSSFVYRFPISVVLFLCSKSFFCSMFIKPIVGILGHFNFFYLFDYFI